MNLLLDTTIQIDRITGSKDRKKAIEKALGDNRLFCSTYVLGEYTANIVTDFVTLYQLFLLNNKDIGETGKRISETVFGRSQGRVSKLYANILSMCEFDAEEVEDTFLLYMDLIQDEFFINVEEVINTTACARADRKVVFEDGIPCLPQISCTRDKEICGICGFWKQASDEAGKLLEASVINDKIKEILKSAKSDEKKYRGKNCMTLGDTIISLEACKDDRELAVCSSNKKDFAPICNVLGVELVSPDYSWKNRQK